MIAKRKKDSRTEHTESVFQTKRYMVKAKLPESQTNGLQWSDYPLQLMGNKDVTGKESATH